MIQRSILDVKATSWHDDYNKFKAGVKDLEVMVQNVINSGFDYISTVQEGVELLEVFAHLTMREVSFCSVAFSSGNSRSFWLSELCSSN